MMKTEVIAVDAPHAREHALELLQRGEVLALPTDTVYGVAADGFNADAIEKLFKAKLRPRDKAIPLLLADADDVEKVALEISDTARILAAKFWPGALTLVVRARENVPPILRAEGDTVAVRVPDYALVRDLARELGHPLAATSANLSGGANPMTAREAQAQLDGRILLILDGGATRGELASTVLDCTVTPPRVLRAGALSVGKIEDGLGIKLE
jgi:L-threonylcarbamoyladenylate synthase